MNDHDEIRRDLDPELDPGEADELASLGTRLLHSRATPSPAFSGRLSHTLFGGPRPFVVAACYALSGSALLVLAALGAAGAGPLAP